MGAADLLHQMAAAGFSVEADGDMLVIRPASKLTDDLRTVLRAAKPALMALLTAPTRPYKLTPAEVADLIGPAGSELSGSTPANSANPAKNRTSIDSAGDSGACEGLRKVANSQPEPAAPEPDSQKFAALRRGCNQPQSEHPCGFSQDSQNSQGVAGTNDPPPDWRALHEAYMAHHWRCVHCIAAGRMPKFERCPTGRLLWNTYTATTNSPTTPKGQP